MDNHEDYLDALTAYSRDPTREIPQVLERYLNGVAKNGETLFQWPLLKPLIVGKTEQVIAELRQGLSSENIPPRPNVENVRFDVMHDRIMDALQKFNGAPFTIQRLCELLVDPKRHYKRSDKFMRGLEKNVLVVSTVDPFGRKVVSESGSKHLVNGMDTNGSPFFPRDSNIGSNLPPVPGWVTSTVSTATPPSSTPATDSTQQKQTQSSQDSTLTANGVPSAIVSSVYADQGEQPLAVHAEEVVEETVVTMDTTEVGAVATDGGEALADEEEEEEVGGEDTNASSSSSSSSSSEELSTSSESSGTGTQVATVSPSSESSESHIRPWASIANEGENKRVTDSPKSDSFSSKTQETPDKSNPQNTSDSNASPSDDASESLPQSSDTTTQQSKSLNVSLGFDTVTSAAEESPTNTTREHQTSESEPDDRMSTSEAELEDHVAEKADLTPTDDSKPSSSNTMPSQNHPEHIRSYAEVVASPSSDCTGHLPLCETEACDSVAGLERLVDSVEPSSMTATFSTLSQFSDSPNQSLRQSESSSPQPSSFPDASEDFEEPQAKRSRMSEDPVSPGRTNDSEVVTSQPDTTSSFTSSPKPLSHSEASSSSNSTAKSDTAVDTTTNTLMTSSSDSDLSQAVPATSSQEERSDTIQSESSDTVSCSQGSESAPSPELGGGDCTQQEQGISSPPSQMASSNDSQGFDVCGDVLRKTSTEEKQTNSESLAGETAPSEATDSHEETSVTESGGPEPMEQE